MSDPLSQWLLSQGVLGVFVVMCGGVILALWRHFNAKLDRKDEEIKNLTVKNASDAKEVVSKAHLEWLSEASKQRELYREVVDRQLELHRTQAETSAKTTEILASMREELKESNNRLELLKVEFMRNHHKEP